MVHKDSLYALAAGLGLDVVPSIARSGRRQIVDWSASNPGPYLLKPALAESPGCALKGKNRVARDQAALLLELERLGTAGLVVQRLLHGGDGQIYDVYGMRDARGRTLALASHRRLRQFPPNLGVSSYGAIPSGLGAADQTLFEDTQRLLGATRFHGVFGVEWLHDAASGRFHLIDFNARPFLSIGHLCDSGINLPLLAYRELAGEVLDAVPTQPEVRPLLWMDLLADLRTQALGTSTNGVSLRRWFREAAQVRSHAYWSWRDPGPGSRRALETAFALVHHLYRPWPARSARLSASPGASLPVAAENAAPAGHDPPA